MRYPISELKNIIIDLQTGKLKNQHFSHENYFQQKFPENYSDIKKYNTFSISLYLYLYWLESVPKCKECWKELKLPSFREWFPTFCSNSCSTKNVDTQSKKNNSSLIKFGGSKELRRKDLKEKIEKTSITRFGSYYTQTENYKKLFAWKVLPDSVKEKMKSTNVLKHWKEYYSMTEEYRIKRAFTRYQKFLEKSKKYIINTVYFDEFYREKDTWTVSCVCRRCEFYFKNRVWFQIRCPKCFPSSRSKTEIELKVYIDSLVWDNSTIINTKKLIYPKELDVYLPGHKLAIEYDGLMFHSVWKSSYSRFRETEGEDEYKNYHLEKTESCKEKWIQLFHIFDSEWLEPVKQDIWKSIISSKLDKNIRLNSRTLKLQEVSYQDSCKFLNDNHLQGEDTSSIRLWLYQILEDWQEELVSLMTFWKTEYEETEIWNLYRVSSKKYITIVWWETKLFSYFKKVYLKDWESIISYSDRRYENWDICEKLWFSLSHKTEPNSFYFTVKEYKIRSSIDYQKHKLKDKLEIFDEDLTESENMYNNWYRKIYDSWNLVYIFKN